MVQQTAPDDQWADAPASRVERFGHRRRKGSAFLVIALVTALGGGLRLYHLSVPGQLVFDEVYYAKDGCWNAGIPFTRCGLATDQEGTVGVHPPLGRIAIGAGVRLFDYTPFGWRVGSAVFGTLGVLLLALIALRLFDSVLWAGVAGLLLATESLHFVQSRISMIDIFLATFVLAGLGALLLDRRWIERRTPVRYFEEEDLLHLPPDRPPSPIMRPWRLAAGAALGAAVATKWSGAPALVAGILLTLGWERTRRRDQGLTHPLREALRDESFGVFLFLIVVPLVVYVASYIPWFFDHDFDIGKWLDLQRGMATYSLNLRDAHPYSSRPWTWLILYRPVAYFYDGAPPGTAAEILGIGNQVIFWGFVICLPYLALAWVRRKDWRAGFILVAFLVQYMPWFLAARTSFLFYMTPMTAFMVLGVVYTLRDLSHVGAEEEREWTGTRLAFASVAGLWTVAAVAVFAFFLPVLTGLEISYDAWRMRMWFGTWI